MTKICSLHETDCFATFLLTEEQCWFQEMVGRKLPKLARHLQGLNCDMSIIATDWFLCLFCTALPSEVLLSLTLYF